MSEQYSKEEIENILVNRLDRFMMDDDIPDLPIPEKPEIDEEYIALAMQLDKLDFPKIPPLMEFCKPIRKEDIGQVVPHLPPISKRRIQ